jgi:hypothetical protein
MQDAIGFGQQKIPRIPSHAADADGVEVAKG